MTKRDKTIVNMAKRACQKAADEVMQPLNNDYQVEVEEDEQNVIVIVKKRQLKKD